MAPDGVYKRLIAKVFTDRYRPGATRVEFKREDIPRAAKALGVPEPRNLGDVLYSFRFRADWPEEIAKTTPPGKQWVIKGEGAAAYAFTLFSGASIAAAEDFEPIKIPNSTPEVVRKYTQSDEQALLAVVRYNRLVDLFLGVTAYSLQNHLRTQVKSIGQIEIDELYVGVNKGGAHFIIPVQAKGGKDKQGVSQVLQDDAFCRANFPNLVPKLIACQFVKGNHVALMELVISRDSIKKRGEAHYLIVPKDDISDEELRQYRETANSD